MHIRDGSSEAMAQVVLSIDLGLDDVHSPEGSGGYPPAGKVGLSYSHPIKREC